ncbi:hypothetical protein GFL92_08050 [Rhizobium leguminosarum bv. viciae]|nr:hypothetical protein [Rhizobium leguminosarum bv. viciae]TCB48035.1 hypothetical protein E0J20_28375 [Rhizobium leguminosarum bv. viciae]
MAATPYLVGFLALCFWWRWWLLLPAGIVAAVVALVQEVDWKAQHQSRRTLREVVTRELRDCLRISGRAACNLRNQARCRPV